MPLCQLRFALRCNAVQLLALLSQPAPAVSLFAEPPPALPPGSLLPPAFASALAQVRLHDLRALKTKKGQKLSDLPGLDKGIAFCTYDLLVR